MEDWPAIRTEFCPWTGKQCHRADSCIIESAELDLRFQYCGEVKNLAHIEPKEGEVKMCRHWNQCLLPATGDCGGTYEECEARACDFLPVIVKIEDLKYPEDTRKEWMKRFGGKDDD